MLLCLLSGMDCHRAPESLDLEHGGNFPLPPWLVQATRRRSQRRVLECRAGSLLLQATLQCLHLYMLLAETELSI